MNRTPLISLIIPIYNSEDFMFDCLNSIINQTYKNIEIICINDGSTDNSLAVIKSFAEKDPRVIVKTIVNNGVSNARNLGIALSKGEYIIFVDSDDWLDLACIENIVNHPRFEDAEIVMFPYISEHNNKSNLRKLFDDDVLFQGEEKKLLSRKLIGPLNDEIIKPSRLDSYGTVWGKIYKRSLIEDIIFVDLTHIGTAEDSLFNMEVFNKARIILYTNASHYHYRKTNINSITSKYNPNLREQWKNLFNIIYTKFCNYDERQALSNRIAISVLGECLNEYLSSTPFVNIRAVLNDTIYEEALAQFNIKRLPLHWKLFYYSAREKYTYIIVILIFIIYKIISR